MTTEQLLTELQRQRVIHARQVGQYTNARARSRFAYASHLTKTRSKIAWLERQLGERGVPVPPE